MKSNTWDKVYVFEGEPYRVGGAFYQTMSKLGSDVRIRRFDRSEDVSLVVGAARAFKMTSAPTVICITRPSADQLKSLQKAVDEGVFTADALAVLYPGDYADGRLGFIKEASKRKRVFSLEYIQDGDRAPLLKYLMDWKRASGVNLTARGAEWLIRNVPVTAVQVKTEKGKREAHVYDLALMFSDLQKLGTYALQENQELGPAELGDMCAFAKSFDMWRWIDAAAHGPSEVLFEQTKRMIDQEVSPSGPMHLLSGQLTLAICIKQLGLEGASDAFDIQSRANPVEYGAQFWYEEAPSDTPPAAPNPYRIKRIQEFVQNQSSLDLSARLIALSSATTDIRRGVPQALALRMLVAALADGALTYQSPKVCARV